MNLSNFPNLKNHIVVWNDFSNLWAFGSKEECLNKMSKFRMSIPKSLYTAEDWSISKIFDDIKKGKRTYSHSSFMKHGIVADLKKFNLPKDFICVCPYSTDKRLKNRDFSKNDWDVLCEYLKKINIMGVVLNNGKDNVPCHPNILDLNNKTNVLESIDILKVSKLYIGIDSCMSILAAKKFNNKQMIIKAVNPQFYDCKSIYCAPNSVNLVKNLTLTELVLNLEKIDRSLPLEVPNQAAP